MNVTPPPFDLRAAWDWACAAVERVAALFGDPVALRDGRVIRNADARLMVGWLRPLEALLRRLLLLEAARRPPPKPRKPLAPRETARRRAPIAAPPRRAFRVLPCTNHPSGGARRPPRKCDPEAFIASHPLAHRFNALVCAIANPDPLVARLARRLYAGDPRALALARLNRRDMRSDDRCAFAAASAAEYAVADFRDALDRVACAFAAINSS
ncbi:MAG: hypothetical protein GC206_09000 [Alphaproteobacteria bacterium]|nr:hypothetical protein [Alphaproteobacteria bacterium]